MAPPTPTRATHRTIINAPSASNLVTFWPYLKKNIIMVKTQLEAKILEIIPALTPLGKANANVKMIKIVIIIYAAALTIGTDSLRPLNKITVFDFFFDATPLFLS